jgi:hypothetical protein
MQKALSLPSKQQNMTFSQFLAALFRAFARKGLRFCVLRNYEGFPANNIGNDVDFLISPSQLPCAIAALQSIEGIRIVGYTERHHVANVFLEGISSAPNNRTLQIDFDLGLTWKGLPYLPTDAVLGAAVSRPAGDLDFFVPSPVHEAIISLFASLLVGGWLKERYFAKVQQTFAGDKSGTIAALLPQFGSKIATQLVDSVIGGDHRQILGCVRSLRASLCIRSLLYRPCSSVLAMLRHHAREFTARYSPMALETVCILGSDSSRQASMVTGLMPLLQSTAKVVEMRPLRPQQPFARESYVAADSGARTRCGSLASMAKVTQLLAQDWLSQFAEKKNLTLRICESGSHDLLIDPQKHGYSTPKWFARLAGKLLPPADLWILLDPASEAIQSRSRETAPAETVSQLEAYRRFVKAKKEHIILDASKPAAGITEDMYAAIIDALAQRTNRKLEARL